MPGRTYRVVVTGHCRRGPDRPACPDGHQQADLRRASQPYPGPLPDCEQMLAAMNFDNLVAVLAVAAAVPLILASVPRAPVTSLTPVHPQLRLRRHPPAR